MPLPGDTGQIPQDIVEKITSHHVIGSRHRLTVAPVDKTADNGPAVDVLIIEVHIEMVSHQHRVFNDSGDAIQFVGSQVYGGNFSQLQAEATYEIPFRAAYPVGLAIVMLKG